MTSEGPGACLGVQGSGRLGDSHIARGGDSGFAALFETHLLCFCFGSLVFHVYFEPVPNALQTLTIVESRGPGVQGSGAKYAWRGSEGPEESGTWAEGSKYRWDPGTPGKISLELYSMFCPGRKQCKKETFYHNLQRLFLLYTDIYFGCFGCLPFSF